MAAAMGQDTVEGEAVELEMCSELPLQHTCQASAETTVVPVGLQTRITAQTEGEAGKEPSSSNITTLTSRRTPNANVLQL